MLAKPKKSFKNSKIFPELSFNRSKKSKKIQGYSLWWNTCPSGFGRLKIFFGGVSTKYFRLVNPKLNSEVVPFSLSYPAIVFPTESIPTVKIHFYLEIILFLLILFLFYFEKFLVQYICNAILIMVGYGWSLNFIILNYSLIT